MLAFDPELNNRLEQLLETRGYGAVKKKMFGHETHFLNGYMFTGANELGIFVHLGSQAVERALDEETGVSRFGPMEGMIMKDYLLLDKEIVDDETALSGWLERSRDYLMSRPPKKPKK